MKALLSYTSFGVSNRTVGIQDAEEGDSVRNDGVCFLVVRHSIVWLLWSHYYNS